MQDRLKFRVWHKKRKRMYEVLHLHTETWSNGGEWVTAKGFNIITQQDIHIQIEPKDGIIMQSTGLRDRDGKLIYEDDIIEFTDNVTINGSKTHVAKVEHNKEFNAYMYHAECMGWYTINPSQNKRFKVKVIGNIYEHPELLEVGNER